MERLREQEEFSGHSLGRRSPESDRKPCARRPSRALSGLQNGPAVGGGGPRAVSGGTFPCKLAHPGIQPHGGQPLCIRKPSGGNCCKWERDQAGTPGLGSKLWASQGGLRQGRVGSKFWVSALSRAEGSSVGLGVVVAGACPLSGPGPLGTCPEGVRKRQRRVWRLQGRPCSRGWEVGRFLPQTQCLGPRTLAGATLMCGFVSKSAGANSLAVQWLTPPYYWGIG